MRITAPVQTAMRSTRYHELEPDLSKDLPSEFITLEALDTPDPYSKKPTLPWKPPYLRRAVLLGFIVVFIFIIITIECLVVSSNKNNGIATGMPSEHYLWTYGPTAFLTVIAAVWARTEYQSKLVAPWFRLSQIHSKDKPPASRTLLLDYISQFPIFAIFSSLRNRDFTVSITLTVSILIKVLIVLSSGLISLDLTNVTRGPYPMVLESKFVDTSARLATTGNLAWYVTTGLGTRNLTLPEGISTEYAYQSLKADLPSNVVETRVITDGLKSSLQCDTVELGLLGAQILGELSIENNLNVTISSPGCNVALASFDQGVLPGKTSFHRIVLPGARNGTVLADNSTLFARFGEVRCDSVKGDAGRRILLLFGSLTYYTNDTSLIAGDELIGATGAILNRSTQLLCVPTYAIDKIEVIHNSTHTQDIIPTQNASSRLLDSVTAWDIADAQFVAGDGPVGYDTRMNIGKDYVDTDVYINTALKYFYPPGMQATDLFDPAVLQRTAEAYYQQVTAIISKLSLMEPASEDVFGYATLKENRLIMYDPIAHSMVGLLAACVVFTIVVLFIFPTDGFLPHSPSWPFSIPLFLHSHDLLAHLRYSGASDEDHLSRWLRPSTFESGLAYDKYSGQAQFCVSINTKDKEWSERDRPVPQISSKVYHPFILHPAFRSVLCLSVIGIIITLELLLRKSNLEDGLGDLGNDHDTYTRYAWALVPPLILGAISMAYSAIDFQLRTLAPYMALRSFVSKDRFSQLDLLDMTIPMAIFREFKLRNFWALTTTTAVLLASIFTILSASLFQELSLPSTTPILLRANQSFLSVKDTSDISGQISSLIFESNFSFPRFTYDDLAFPQFTTILDSSESTAHPNASSVSISTVLPAVRGRMHCRSYETAYIHTSITLNYTNDYGIHNPLEVFIAKENCDVWSDDSYPPPKFRMGTNAKATYFGLATPYNYSDVYTCSDFVYIWGKIDYSAHPIVQHIDAIGCNMTLEAVDVDTTFVGTDLNIDPQKPPQPVNGSARNTTIDDYDYISNLQIRSYADLADIDVDPQVLDPFFATLVTSPWAIPLSTLGDSATRDDVIAAIKSHHGIMNAQALALSLGPASETNTTIAGPIRHGDNDAQPCYNATVTDPTSRRRVVQDAASTHVLVALLAFTLVLSLVGWAGNPGTNVLPRSPTTIASTAALIAGGNLIAHAPTDGRSPMDVVDALGGPGARFWLGWGNLPDEEGRLHGGENEAGVSQFGIFVADEDDLELKKLAHPGYQSA